MTRKFTALFAVLALFAVMGVSYLGADHHMGSWKGEIIDVTCHVAKGGKGSGHSQCGAACVKAGLPVGLLVGETTYILVGADHKPVNAKMAEHVGHMVEVNGTKYESAGANIIEVKDFKMAK